MQDQLCLHSTCIVHYDDLNSTGVSRGKKKSQKFGSFKKKASSLHRNKTNMYQVITHSKQSRMFPLGGNQCWCGGIAKNR